jgi:hypothetical protein
VTPRPHAAECRWFWTWALVGAGASLGVVSLGLLALAPVVLMGSLLATNPAAHRPAAGLLTGAGLLLIYVAWLQRAGPGVTCWHTATASGCDEHLNPVPWLLGGLVMFVAGIVAQASRDRLP